MCAIKEASGVMRGERKVFEFIFSIQIYTHSQTLMLNILLYFHVMTPRYATQLIHACFCVRDVTNFSITFALSSQQGPV
jgi:hypothetical protein